jgi:uncharacterized protein (TIGR02391 family)
MVELSTSIPSLEVLQGLTVEQTAGKILETWLRDDRDGLLHESKFINSVAPKHTHLAKVGYPHSRQTRAVVEKAIFEAWAWLEGQALIVKGDTINPTYRVLSRRAREFADSDAFLPWEETRFLRRENLTHLPAVVWHRFAQGELTDAVQKAMKHVEIEIRRVGGFGDADLGKAMVGTAFAPGDDQGTRAPGPLTDMELPVGERHGILALFQGAIATYRNPSAHREMDFQHAAEAAEIIMFANSLARMVTRAEERIAAR